MEYKYKRILWDIEKFLNENIDFKKKKKLVNFEKITRNVFIEKENRGNNSFQYYPDKKIHIARIVQGNKDDIKKGNKITFIETIDNKLKKEIGIKDFVCGYTNKSNTPIFICDNHNHVLEAWNLFSDENLKLIHIDQHKDNKRFIGNTNNWRKESKICDYIDCAIKKNWIKKDYYSFINNSDLKHLDAIKKIPNNILNIDLDFFSQEATHISLENKLKLILFFLSKAQIITLATSPLFIDQDFAIEIGKLFWEYL